MDEKSWIERLVCWFGFHFLNTYVHYGLAGSEWAVERCSSCDYIGFYSRGIANLKTYYYEPQAAHLLIMDRIADGRYEVNK